jgi:hypothetical protein
VLQLADQLVEVQQLIDVEVDALTDRLATTSGFSRMKRLSSMASSPRSAYTDLGRVSGRAAGLRTPDPGSARFDPRRVAARPRSGYQPARTVTAAREPCPASAPSRPGVIGRSLRGLDLSTMAWARPRAATRHA